MIVPRDGAALGIPEPLIQRSIEMMRYRTSTFRRAVEAGLTIGFGTDAGVFEHGHNAREFQVRVDAGQSEMDAITSATSVSAMIMGWEADVGSVEPGKYADIIAVPGNPLEDITAMERVMWVMKGGEVYRDDFVQPDEPSRSEEPPQPEEPSQPHDPSRPDEPSEPDSSARQR